MQPPESCPPALPFDQIGGYRNREALLDLRRDFADQGRKVVFTNGCFDLLHVGHVRYLQASKRRGDILVVGLNSDASVRRLKGPDRPIRSLPHRLEMLDALSCVDYLTEFDEDAVTPLLLELAPDIYTKGGDYTLESIDSGLREAVVKHGICIEFLDHVEGVSTTELLVKTRS